MKLSSLEKAHWDAVARASLNLESVGMRTTHCCGPTVCRVLYYRSHTEPVFPTRLQALQIQDLHPPFLTFVLLAITQKACHEVDIQWTCWVNEWFHLNLRSQRLPGGSEANTSPSSSGDMDSISGWGAKTLHASQSKDENIKQKR